MAKKYYAVRVGKTPGVYGTWDECKVQVNGFPGAKYKSFGTLKEAEDFVGIKTAKETGEKMIKEKIEDVSAIELNLSYPYAFVDGSYRDGIYGFGGFLQVNAKDRYTLVGSGNIPSLAATHNVAGEMLGAVCAVKEAKKLGLKRLTIYYDYMGIEMWATGGWKTNNLHTYQYSQFMQKCGVALNFVKVKGHSGIPGNELADSFAKKAVDEKLYLNKVTLN